MWLFFFNLELVNSYALAVVNVYAYARRLYRKKRIVVLLAQHIHDRERIGCGRLQPAAATAEDEKVGCLAAKGFAQPLIVVYMA